MPFGRRRPKWLNQSEFAALTKYLATPCADNMDPAKSTVNRFQDIERSRTWHRTRRRKPTWLSRWKSRIGVGRASRSTCARVSDLRAARHILRYGSRKLHALFSV